MVKRNEHPPQMWATGPKNIHRLFGGVRHIGGIDTCVVFLN